MPIQIFPEATISIPSTLGTVTTLASSSSTYIDSTSDYTAGGYTVGAGGGGAYNTGRGGDGSPGVVFLWKY